MKAKLNNLIVRYERKRDNIRSEAFGNEARLDMIETFIDDLKRLAIKPSKAAR